MKIFAFIMAFLVLALSILPCADKGDVLNRGKAKTQIAETTHEQGDQQEDDCSPFCHCTCCATFSINHFIATIIIIPPQDDKTQTAYLPYNVIAVAIPVWQPPQLA
jgi:hypothetical protein